MNHLVKHLRRLNGKQSKPVKYFDITTPYFFYKKFGEYLFPYVVLIYQENGS